MNLHHLRYFLTLAKMEHYTKAAERLMITQPSLSAAIASLEAEVGVPLFEKKGRNIVLTKYGKRFEDDVEKSLKILDYGVNTLQMTSSGEGRIDLAFLRALGTNFIPEIVHEFLQKNPEKTIDFYFYTGISNDIIHGLKEREYDIAFCSKLEKENDIEFIPVAKRKLVLIVSPDHPLAERDMVDLEETLPYPQILFDKKSGIRPVIDELFRKINCQPIVAHEILEDEVIAGLVAKNFGIAICPNMAILDFMDVKIIPIANLNWERYFYLAVMKDVHLPPLVQEFKEFAIQKAQL